MERILLEGKGFSVMKDYGGWRVALITYESKKNSLEEFEIYGRHNATDEVFVLLNGSAKMVLGGMEETPQNLRVEELKTDEVFVVECSEWHAILVEEGSKVLVVENRDTDSSNTDNIRVKPEERDYIKNIING